MTEADVASERSLTSGLLDLLPHASVIGEEAAASDPSLVATVAERELAWVVDPLDGTKHFADGTGPFGIMVALVRNGVTEAGWIHLPLTDDLAVAWRGAGAHLNGDRIDVPAPPHDGPLRGGLLTRFFPGELKAHADACSDLERTDARHKCSAQRYVDLVRGAEQFAAYWRTLPWDHLAGALVVTEAGGEARRFDGSPFLASDVEGTSLLVASDDRTWRDVRRRALGLG